MRDYPQNAEQPLSAVMFIPTVLLQGQRGRLSSRAALDHLGAMEEGEAENEAPVAAREGPSGHSQRSEPQSTTTNLLASVKEQVGDHQQHPSHLQPAFLCQLDIMCSSQFKGNETISMVVILSILRLWAVVSCSEMHK